MLGLRLDVATEERLARVARRQGRTKSDLAREALSDFLNRAEDDADLIAELKRITAATSERDLAVLDDLIDDLHELLEEEEANIAASRTA